MEINYRIFITNKKGKLIMSADYDSYNLAEAKMNAILAEQPETLSGRIEKFVKKEII